MGERQHWERLPPWGRQMLAPPLPIPPGTPKSSWKKWGVIGLVLGCAIIVLALAACERRSASDICRGVSSSGFERCVESVKRGVSFNSSSYTPAPITYSAPSLSQPPRAPTGYAPTNLGQSVTTGTAQPQFIPYGGVSGAMPGIGPSGTPR